MSSIYPVNKFKNAIYPAISTSSSSATEVYRDAEVVGEGYALVTSMIGANKTNTPRKFFLILEKAGNTNNTAFILYNVIIPANTAFEIIEGNKFVLKEGDRLLAYSDNEAGGNAGVVDVTCSYVVHVPPT